MTTDQILSLGAELADFLREFSDCFGRAEPRGKLETYVRGQLGQLPRKSVEPMALAAGMTPRTLQEFLASDEWDEDRLAARVQTLVAREHADPQAIGFIDESGHPKKGNKTAGVARQYCGNTGKIDNCVTTVHLTYASFHGEFRTMIDSELYLPKCWDEDRERCHVARIPDDVVYRPKYEMALAQVDRATARGVYFAWITADEWYTQKSAFVAGLERRSQRLVLETPRNFAVWPHDPARGPEISSKSVENLWRYSRAKMRQSWQRYVIKDTDKGPMVWEVKSTPCWLPRSGGVVGPYWLIVARNTLDPSEVKYFISNAASGVPLAALLHVAFGRWPVERVLEDEKSELGLSHFEVRCYPALKRHLPITHVSHLFLARQTQRLREKKSRDHFATSPSGHQRADRGTTTSSGLSPRAPRPDRTPIATLAVAQHPSSKKSHQDPHPTPRQTPNRPPSPSTLSPRMMMEGAL